MTDGIIKLDEGWHLDAGHRLDQPMNLPSPVTRRVPLPQKQKGKAMDYIPRKRAEMKEWYQNLAAHAVAEAAKVGATSADGAALKASAEKVVALIQASDEADAVLTATRSMEKNGLPALEQSVRATIKNWKTLPTYPESGIEGVLKLRSPTSAFDPQTHDLKPKVKLEGLKIRLDFVRGGFDAVAVYSRLRGAAGWARLGTDSFPPYYDTQPLGNAAVAETREYMLRGMIDDEEVGPASDIVSLVVG